MADEKVFIETYLTSFENDDEINEENVKRFNNILKQIHLFDYSDKICQIIADVAKSENGRNKCTTIEIITYLISNILPYQMNDKSVSVASVQACRAIGNICFDNDEAREIVSSLNGAEKLLELLNLLLKDMNFIPNDNNLIIASKQLDQDTFNGCAVNNDRDNILDSKKVFNDFNSPIYHRKVVIGCIFNLVNDNESLSEKMVNLGIIDSLQLLLFRDIEESILHLVLNILDFFLDYDFARSKIIDKKVVNLISDIIFHESDSVIEHTFQTMVNMVDTDAEKIVAIDGGIYPNLVKLIDIRQVLNSDKILQLAADFVVLLLNGDESMYRLNEVGVSEVALDWVKSSNQILQISGAFALSNIARSDETCQQLMQKNILENIYLVLETSKPEDIENHDLQHALISVIRNLAVPNFNKEVLITKNVISKILPYLYCSSKSVIFKSLITIRLLVNKKNLAKTNLLNNQEFIEYFLQLTEDSSNNSIQCEAQRLLSYFILQCDDNKFLTYLYNRKAFDLMCEMMMSKHDVMSTEALQALDVFMQAVSDVIEDNKQKIYCENLNKILVIKLPVDGSNISDENSAKLITNVMGSLNKWIQHEKWKKYCQEIDLKQNVEAWCKLNINEELRDLCNYFLKQ